MNRKYIALSLVIFSSAAQFNATPTAKVAATAAVVVKKSMHPTLKVLIGTVGVTTAAAVGYTGYTCHEHGYQTEQTLNAIKQNAEQLANSTQTAFNKTADTTTTEFNNVKTKTQELIAESKAKFEKWKNEKNK